MKTIPCNTPLDEHEQTEGWCTQDSTWALIYTSPADKLSVMYCCGEHMDAAASLVMRLRHPDYARISLANIKEMEE